MVPTQNARHVVLDTKFDRIDDLIGALRDKGIIPRRVPKVGWGEFSYSLARFNAEFRLLYALDLLEPRIDAFRAGTEDIHRISLAVNPARFQIQLFDTRLKQMLTDFDFALAGRAAILAEVRVVNSDRAAYVDFKKFAFRIDDVTRQVPLPLPIEDLQWIVERGVNREFRGSYDAPLPQKNLPITAALNDGDGVALSFGYNLRDITPMDDRFERRLCLPGNTCQPGQPVTREFYTFFDLSGRLGGFQVPQPINPLQPRRQFQADVGRDVVDLVLSRVKQLPEVSSNMRGQKNVLGGVFRAEWDFDFYIAAWRDSDKSGGDAGIEVSGYLDFKIAYPEIQWCTKKVFGITIPYPCGIKISYATLERFEPVVQVQPYVHDMEICLRRTEISVVSHTTIVGHIVKFLVAATVGAILGLFLGALVPIPGVGAAIGFGLGVMVFVALESLARIISIIANKRIPDTKCKSIEQYMTVPIVKGKIDAAISNPKMSFDLTGTSLSFDGDFRDI